MELRFSESFQPLLVDDLKSSPRRCYGLRFTRP